jgi:hypothetical protein
MLTSRWCWLEAAIGVVLAVLVPTANGHWNRTWWQAPTTALGMAVLSTSWSTAGGAVTPSS